MQTVAILMCTYNGARYLSAQLDSIGEQTHKDWVIYASDDGSDDATLAVLHHYRDKFEGRLEIISGPRQGFTRNFLHVLNHACGKADFYAFCDQDDFWYPQKIARGMAFFEGGDASIPQLYCGRTTIADEAGHPVGLSPRFSKAPSFRNALVQNIAAGNTMIINQAACKLLASTPRQLRLAAHDWWSYLLVTSVGGRVHYDDVPMIFYRQHGANAIGANVSIASRFERLARLFKGVLKEWSDDNITGLGLYRQRLTQENLVLLDGFVKARQSGLAKRCYLFCRLGIYRQTFFGTLGLGLAIFLNKI